MTGYADLALSAYFLASGIFILLFAKEGRSPFAFIASFMLASGAWTKNEGLTFALLGFLALCVIALLNKRGGLRSLAISLSPLALFILPWSIYKAVHGLGNEYVQTMGPGVFFSNISRLASIIPYVADFMFLKPGVIGLAWWAYAITALLGLKRMLADKTIVLHWLILGQLGVYIFVYTITPLDLIWHLATSVDRLLMQLIALAMLAAAACLGNLAGCKGR